MSAPLDLRHDVVAQAVSNELIARLKGDLKRRVMATLESEIEAMIDEAARAMVVRIHQADDPASFGIVYRIAVNGVPRPGETVVRS